MIWYLDVCDILTNDVSKGNECINVYLLLDDVGNTYSV